MDRVRRKYIKGSSIWEVKPKQTDSWAWKDIIVVRGEATDCIRCLIGNGSKTLAWTDPWLPQGRIVSLVGRQIVFDFGRGKCADSDCLQEG